MNGSTFKRRLPSGRTEWCYSFLAGRDTNSKRIITFKGGFDTKGAASEALRDAIKEHEKTHGKVTKRRGILGTVIWGYEFGDEKKSGFADQAAATAALAAAVERCGAVEQAPAENDPTFAEYIKYWLDEHASRTLAPKTVERYGEFAA